MQADTALQASLGLTSAQIGQLIDYVNGQMTAAGGSGGIPAGFQTGLGDVNGDGTGSGTSYAARHTGAVVKVQHPSVRQLAPTGSGTYPRTIQPDNPLAYWRLGETPRHRRRRLHRQRQCRHLHRRLHARRTRAAAERLGQGGDAQRLDRLRRGGQPRRLPAHDRHVEAWVKTSGAGRRLPRRSSPGSAGRGGCTC